MRVRPLRPKPRRWWSLWRWLGYLLNGLDT